MGYLGAVNNKTLQIVLAVIPFTSWILGGVTRLQRGHIISGLVNLFTPVVICFWIIDILDSVNSGDIKLWANK